MIVLVFYSIQNKISQIGCVRTTELYSLTVLKVTSLRSRGCQGCVASEALEENSPFFSLSSSGCWPSLPFLSLQVCHSNFHLSSSHGLSYMCVLCLLFSLFKGTSQ